MSGFSNVVPFTTAYQFGSLSTYHAVLQYMLFHASNRNVGGLPHGLNCAVNATGIMAGASGSTGGI
mgnify:CR=1 FL=1